MNNTVKYETHQTVATITLNRPDKLNAMNNDLMIGISEAMAQVETDKSIRVVVITGAGRGFCAGADLQGVADSDNSSSAAPTHGMGDYFNPAMQSIHNSPVPTIAKVNGAAGGGGFGLALACDITIAARSAFFVATFGPRLGIVPDLGTTWNLPHKVGRARAMGIAMLGGRISAEQAEDWGLIWKCVDDEKLDEEVDQVTNLLSRTSAEAMSRIRSSIDAAENNTFSEQLDLEMEHQSVLIPKNMQAAAKAFMEKKDPSFEGR